MALQKNIKEVESTEAGFVANAAAKNDGFLTDVIGYPMIKRRGNDYDYWFPEKSRDELGTYTYYDKTVKDLTALNDCIVQRRLSSYGDADTYFDLSTDDQVVLNVGGVPFLTVAESGGAAVGTLGGNLALGANTISRDGAPNKGIGVSEGGIPTVTATAALSGDVRTVLRLYDDTAYEINNGVGNGAGINLYGKARDDGPYTNFGGIKISKENEILGNNSSSFYIQTRKQGSEPANALRLDSDQNGYIKGKLMVGSLTETPDNQLVVYNAGETDTFIQVANGATGSGSEAGLIIGVEADGDAVLRVGGGNLTLDAELYINNLPAKSDPTTTVLVPGPDGCVSTRTVAQIRSDIGAVSTSDPRLSDARVPINNDYYVQGTSSSRTTDAGSTDVNTYMQSGFYRATSTAPNLPIATNFGIIHTNHNASTPNAFQLASWWSDNRLYYRTKQNDTWKPWVELYHTGNLNPADYALVGHNHAIADVTSLQTALDGKQPLDSDLTAIAGLTHSNRHVMVSNGSSWIRRALEEADLPSLSISKITGLQTLLDGKEPAITGTGNKVLSIQADGTGVKTGSIYDDGNVVLIGKTTATGGYKLEVEGDAFINGNLHMGGNLALGANYLNYDGTANQGIVFTSSQQIIIKNTDGIALGDAKQMVSIREDTGNGDAGNGAGISFHGNDGVSATKLFGGIKAYKENSIAGDQNASVYIQTRANGSDPANALRLDSSQNGYIKNKLMVGSLDETPENQLVVYNAGATDTFIQVSNGVTGPGYGLKVGVEAAFGDAVLKVDYGRFLKFQCNHITGPIEMAVLRYTGTTLFNVDGNIQCDAFRLDQNPIAGTITPDKYIIINCNGTDYKIPVAAA